MDVTANDVEQVRFPQGRKGYDPDVVDQFLDRVAATLRNMDERLRDLAARNRSLEEQLAEQREAEAIMRRTLQVAQRTADETVAEAQARAREMISAAEAKAQETERRAAERVRELEAQLNKQRQLVEADIEALRQYYHDFTEKIGQVINEFMAVLQRAETVAETRPPEQPSLATVTRGEWAGGLPAAHGAPAQQEPPLQAGAPRPPTSQSQAPAPPAPPQPQPAPRPDTGEAGRPGPPPPPQPRVAPPRGPEGGSQTQAIDDFGVREAEPPRPATAPQIPEE